MSRSGRETNWECSGIRGVDRRVRKVFNSGAFAARHLQKRHVK